MPPVIQVQDLCFSYGEQEILHNVSFDVPPHGLVAIVGPNGGGKTTLLQLLLGELTPRYGTIRVFGEVPEKARLRIGYVPQSIPFDSRFPASVREIVLMGRIAKSRFGHYSAADRQAADFALERVELAGFDARPFSKLSGGERQRVLIAQALSGGSELLLLDEPVANVDPEHSSRLYDLFSRLTDTITILMVSHNLSVVTEHATHVLCVNRGAVMHAIHEVTSSVFTEAFGGHFAEIHHSADCHIVDPTPWLHTPHHGSPHQPATTEEEAPR